jgi:thioredoxin reductase
MEPGYDVVIVGGGAAGLSAALVLGRCRRTVLICDDGHPRNQASLAAHCLLGNEGLKPANLLAKGRRELASYESVTIRDEQVIAVSNKAAQFTVTCEGGFAATARKVLLTTGLKDELPQIEGIEPLYGRSVHHCPYCDGFEHRDQAIAVYGKGDKGAGLALMMKQWSADVMLFTDGQTEIEPDVKTRLERNGITVSTDKIERLEGDSQGRLSLIRLAGERGLSRDALFFATDAVQRSDLLEKLGCRRDENGGIVCDPVTEESSVPGVYVAGDASREVLLVAVAIAEGAKAAVAINRALLKEDGLAKTPGNEPPF